MATQIQQLLQDKQFELALQLAVSLSWLWYLGRKLLFTKVRGVFANIHTYFRLEEIHSRMSVTCLYHCTDTCRPAMAVLEPLGSPHLACTHTFLVVAASNVGMGWCWRDSVNFAPVPAVLPCQKLTRRLTSGSVAFLEHPAWCLLSCIEDGFDVRKQLRGPGAVA